MKQKTMGAYWEDSGYSKLYQLYRRVEIVAVKLNKRRKLRWVPTKKYITELYTIAEQLKALDGEYNRQRRKAPRRCTNSTSFPFVPDTALLLSSSEGSIALCLQGGASRKEDSPRE